MLDAYLDIETTGLSAVYGAITVIGIYLTEDNEDTFIQLVGNRVTKRNLLRSLKGVDTIYTYNGSRFDLPFIHAFLSLDLTDRYRHCDLMYDCWQVNLYGGLKAVEQRLGIPRALAGMSGRDAIILWWKYCHGGDQDALTQLLRYNKEDVVNLKVVREKLLTLTSRGMGSSFRPS